MSRSSSPTTDGPAVAEGDGATVAPAVATPDGAAGGAAVAIEASGWIAVRSLVTSPHATTATNMVANAVRWTITRQ
ncbi:MAG: hypothetical protein AB7R89_22820 [Dehalococcoidia bacterium]